MSTWWEIGSFSLFGACTGPSSGDITDNELVLADARRDSQRDIPAEHVIDISLSMAKTHWGSPGRPSTISDASTEDANSEVGTVDEVSPDTEAMRGIDDLSSYAETDTECDTFCEDDVSVHSTGMTGSALVPLPACAAAGCTIMSALHAGRALEAHRELSRLLSVGADANSLVDAAVKERLDRIADRYRKSLVAFETRSNKGWVQENSRAGFDFAFRINGEQVDMFADIAFDNCDPLYALAALREMDLCPAYKPNVSKARSLGDDLHAVDALWMIDQTGQFSGQKEDSIVEIVALDALDEPMKALWISFANPTTNDTNSLRGVALPPVEKGTRRIQDGCTTFRITPKPSMGGFQLAVAARARIPAAVSKMPSFAMKMIMRRDMQNFAERLRHHIKGCDELQHRVERSSRAVFYRGIEQHLQDCKRGP
jgi:hypothetical protein